MAKKNSITLIQKYIEGNARTQSPFLNIANSGITELPASIGDLVHLKSLYLGGNAISMLPPEISNLRNLERLSLSGNPLNHFPPQIINLKSLIKLSLRGTKIAKLPHEIGKLSNINDLDISNNYLTELPIEIQKLNKLRILDLDGNLLNLPPEIVTRRNDPESIFSYYFSLKKEQKKRLNEIKILVVGQGSVGKTSIICRLLGGEYNSGQSKTEGITINRWQIDLPSKIDKKRSKFQLNIWDFGGQEIMHATHQFFLTKRSLYLLVLDSRLSQEANRVEYWLKIIQSFGGDSPVLIVGNKIDQHPLDIDRTGLRKKYETIVDILETSAATGAGIDLLSATIANQVKVLPHVNDLFPETWFTVKTYVENLGKEENFITYDRYIDLCNKNNVIDKISQRTLIGFLHDLGVILHFQNDPRLESLGILNPQWVTNGVYRILNSHILFQNKGVLTISMLNEILDLPQYPNDKHLFIVDMMRKFELCYDIEADKSFLVPDLLPNNEPYTGEWNNALTFQYHYNVLPNSVISRFIVRMNTYIYKTIWRSGVILKKGNNTALIKADIEERRIFIWVCGDEPTRRDLLSAIRAEFEVIHRSIVKIEVSDNVPHPDFPGVVFEYNELLQFERDGITEFPKSINGKTIKVSVQKLLNGISEPGIRQINLSDAYQHDVNLKIERLYIGGQHETHKVDTQGGVYIGGSVDNTGGIFTGNDNTTISIVFPPATIRNGHGDN